MECELAKPSLLAANADGFCSSRLLQLLRLRRSFDSRAWTGWNLICRFGLTLVDGIQLIMCVAPAVQFYPLYGELFGDRVTDASKRTIENILSKTNLTPAIIPGGFSEATYTNADPNVEYAYCADRVGFVRCAIAAGVDIIPAYSYGLNDMYTTLGWQRHWRAVKAQAWGLPTVLWSGPYGLGNVPFTEDITVVTFDPFPASSYTLDQAVQAHADYMDYLKRVRCNILEPQPRSQRLHAHSPVPRLALTPQCFDSKKEEVGHGHKRLEFIGKAQPPAPVPRSKL